MSDFIHVSRITVETRETKTHLSALVDGRELYFTFTGSVALGDVPSAFLVCCIYPAMVYGRSIVVDPAHEVSARLLENLSCFQDIYLQWWPTLKRVTVDARRRYDPLPIPGDVGSMFSGGVDSFYTYLRNEDRISRLVFAGGLDIAADETDRFEQSVRNYAAFAASRGKDLVSLWTNIKGFWPQVKMAPHHGQVLAALGIMLGFSTTLIPASHSYAELDPWGSHPLTDPLVSTESTDTDHHGALPRREKIRVVGTDAQCMSMLRVCNSSDQYNCGVCEKCLRTRVSLRLLGLNSEALAPLESLGAIRALRLHSDSELTFWEDNLVLAREVRDRAAEKAIRSLVHGYELRRALRRVQSIIRNP